MALGLTNVTQTAEKVEQNSPEEIALSFFKIGQRESGCYGLNCGGNQYTVFILNSSLMSLSPQDS